MTGIFCANLLQRANIPKLCFGDESATPYAIKNPQLDAEFFIKWTTGHTFTKKETIYVIGQSLPDQLEESEDEAIRKGLPDVCIYTENGWILIIESKVAARVSINQLNRHINTLKNRGFTDTSGH